MAHHHNHRHLDRMPRRAKNMADEIWDSLNQHDRRQQGSDDDEPTTTGGGTTIVRTIIQTLSPTFTGEIAGYRTLSSGDDAIPTTTTRTPSAATTIQSLAPPIRVDQSTTSGTDRTTTTTGTSPTTTTTMPSVISEPTKSSVAATLAVDTNTPVIPPTPTRSADSERAANASASASSEPSGAGTGSGTSGAATAGIVIGVLAGLLVIGLAVFFLFRRRKKQMQQQRMEDDEKANPPPFVAMATAGPPSPTPRSDPRAPRLSLRPVTQLFPNFSFDKRASKGANIALGPATAAAGGGIAAGAPGPSPSDRPMTAESTDPNNPFGQQAERVPSPIPEDDPVDHNETAEKPLPPGPAPVSAPSIDTHASTAPSAATATATAAGVAAAAVAAGTLTRKASTRNGGPKAVDLTLPPPLSEVPPSPAGTEFSISSEAPGQSIPHSSSAAAIAAAGGPTNSTVHRVQLDFKPTLEDEMELRAGQLVRLLHEYDDGWALCIRLDRSQQGVVPRTCLSTRPVKPRPQNAGPRGPPGPHGPPRGPGPHHHPGHPRPMQGPGPHGPPGPYGGPPRPGPGPGPQSPMRPMPGPGRPASPAGRRPSSPSSARGMSPGSRYQGPPASRPQSPNGMARSQSPAGVARSPPQPSRMDPAGSPPQHRQPESPPGPPTGPVGRKPLPGQAM